MIERVSRGPHEGEEFFVQCDSCSACDTFDEWPIPALKKQGWQVRPDKENEGEWLLFCSHECVEYLLGI